MRQAWTYRLQVAMNCSILRELLHLMIRSTMCSEMHSGCNRKNHRNSLQDPRTALARKRSVHEKTREERQRKEREIETKRENGTVHTTAIPNIPVTNCVEPTAHRVLPSLTQERESCQQRRDSPAQTCTCTPGEHVLEKVRGEVLQKAHCACHEEKRQEDVLSVRNEDVEQLQPAGTTDEGRDKKPVLVCHSC